MAIDAIARGIAGAAQVGLAKANEKIDRLEGKTTRLLYSASTNPTASDIDTFVTGLGYTSPFEGVAVVVSGTYHIWHYYENDSIGWRDDGLDTITPFTNSVAGSILGSTDDGKIVANQDGTGSVNGWGNKLDKVTEITGMYQLYGKSTTGTQGMLNVTSEFQSPESHGATVVFRNAKGQSSFGAPTESTHAANKGYVDNKLTATLTQLQDGTYSLTFGV